MISSILLNILGPILLLIALGALLRRRFGLDLTTLSKLNIYLLTPAFIFKHVAYSKLTWASMGGIVAITVPAGKEDARTAAGIVRVRRG